MTRLTRLLVLLALVFAVPANATVTNSQNSVTIAGNGSQTVFGFGFVGVSASDISVIFTNSSGVSTTLTQGPGSTQYQVVLNSPVPGTIWGVGGTVTYDPSGTPIPSGSTLTIIRTVPNQQTVSLQNQASYGQYAVAAEQGLDLLEMQIQQSVNATQRAITAPAVDTNPNMVLPPAAQRANQALVFDGSGNVGVGALPASGIISSAMQPVVAASSVAAGRAALGLGTMAQENINGGTCGGNTLQDDGSGNARVVFQTVSDASNQTVTCAFHGTQRAATGALVYTLPRANTLFNGFGFWVYALTQNVTLTPNASDNFPGQSGGASVVIPAGSQAYIGTNAAASGAWYLTLTDPFTLRNSPSLNVPYNLRIVCSVAANALTCAVKDQNGNDPSPASPVLGALQFFSGGAANTAQFAITSPMSITAPAGASMGTGNGRLSRIWIGLFDNGVTLSLGFYNSLSLTGPTVVPWNEIATPAGTAISSSATSAQTWYTAGSITSAFRILGYVESTQSTAGQWASAPSQVVLFGPGIKRPGETVTRTWATTTTAFSTTSTAFVPTGFTASITPSSAANLVGGQLVWTGSPTGNFAMIVSIMRNGTPVGTPASLDVLGANFGTTISMFVEAPNAASSLTYGASILSASGANVTFTPSNQAAMFQLEEIQI